MCNYERALRQMLLDMKGLEMAEYPTNKELNYIRTWQGTDFHELMAYIRDVWHFADCGYWKQAGNIYYISTGGWSGNEDIIEAMIENTMFWALHWCASERGGHYVFKSLVHEILKGD